MELWVGKGGKWTFSPETGSNRGYSPKFRLFSLISRAPEQKFFPWVCSNPIPLLQKITPDSFQAMFERQLCARFLSQPPFEQQI